MEVRYTSQVSNDSQRSCQLPNDIDLTSNLYASGDTASDSVTANSPPVTTKQPSPEKTNIVDDIVHQSNMEKFLEADDEGPTFKEDRLLLEIDAVLEDEIDEPSTQEVHSPLDAPVHYFKGEGVNITTNSEEGQRTSLKRKAWLSTQASTDSNVSNDSIFHVDDHFTKPSSVPLNSGSLGFPLAIFTKVT
jgi:hypothetical protein